MLFGYPIETTLENWLHECLYEILNLIHTSLERGESLPDWPEIIPEVYRRKLQRRIGLRDRIENYYIALEKITPIERLQIWQAVKDQNQIPLLLACQLDCQIISDLPHIAQKTIKDLFEFAFGLLTDLKIRDKHYQEIYNIVEHHICPFCGCEDFDAPSAPREALDHYLPESKYCFVGANLRNLVPMGNKCNSKYKLAKDILRKEDGSRRRCFDPYNHGKVEISLDKSEPFAGTLGSVGEPLPKWIIEFEPNSEEVNTWDEVFCIRERYERDVLNADFNSYVTEFVGYCQSQKFSKPLPVSKEELVEELEKYTFFQEYGGLNSKAFLKVAVFRMLYLHCKEGHQRLIKFLLDYIHGVSV